MKKTFLLIISTLALILPTLAQTKVFKEVNNDISSQMKTIMQDGALVGYLVFTTLERADADSFNYRLTIMDENLNDIGVLDFREHALKLQAVSFEQDVLCLAYLKSNIIGQDFKDKREYKRSLEAENSSVFTQFVNLDGKIIKTNAVKTRMDYYSTGSSSRGYKVSGEGRLKHTIQLSNVPGKGFACFYGDETKKNLLVYNTAGVQTWQKKIGDVAESYSMLTSGEEVYILLKKKHKMTEGGFELLGFGLNDGTVYPKYELVDKNRRALKVLAFDNDPATGRPYLSGSIIDPRRGNKHMSPKQHRKGPYCGVFTINLKEPGKKGREEIFSYWSDGSQAGITPRGMIESKGVNAWLYESFRDYEGNTYFAGSGYIKKTRWGAIATSVVTAPLIFPPLMILTSWGTQKCRITEALLMKQQPGGRLQLETAIKGDKTRYFPAKVPWEYHTRKAFYFVTNAETKTNYMIITDVKNEIVYNVNQQKVIRTIPHKDGDTQTYLYPAKEGHVMVSEYNRREKYTRFSIESL